MSTAVPEMTRIFGELPASLAWAVAFRLDDLAALAGPERVYAAFGLGVPSSPDGEGASHVVLTSSGPQLWDGALRRLTAEPVGGRPVPSGTPGRASLAERFAGLLRLADLEDACCVGLGELEAGRPVLMTVRSVPVGDEPTGDEPAASAEGLLGEAWFVAEPTRHDWELLPAVGVRPRAGTARLGPGGPWYVSFDVSLTEHLEAAHLAGYARTWNCNDFFLRQGRVEPSVRSGLQRAGSSRLGTARHHAYDRALHVAENATRNEGGGALMTAVGPNGPTPYGDLVPLGMLLLGLRQLPEDSPPRAKRGLATVLPLRRRLQENAIDGGWPFHTGTVTTGLDSALVLLGLGDALSVPGLERFREPSGGYAADRTGPPGPSTVAPDPATAHWHAPDIATTSLARFLRRDAGLAEATPASWLGERFETRGSPFIACPWLLDWLVALGLEGDPSPDAGELRRRLLGDVLSSRADDGSFGRQDERVLASASAVLALRALGADGTTLAGAQLALVRATRRIETTSLSLSVPFYSTARCSDERQRARALRLLLRGGDVLTVGGELHLLTTYRDTAGAVTAGLVASALSGLGDLGSVSAGQPSRPAERPHPRYRCASVNEYVGRFALGPALAEVPTGTR